MQNSRMLELTLPSTLSRQNAENDSLAGTDSTDTDGLGIGLVQWSMEETSDNINTSGFNFTTGRVFLEIDEVLITIGVVG